MNPRFILAIQDGSPDWNVNLDRLVSQTGLEIGFRNEQLAALVTPACNCLSVGDSGCVLGSIFRRHGPARPIITFTDEENASILARKGETLGRTFWGSYVAAIARPGSVTVLRDPSAAFPCYFAVCDGVPVFSSDAELLADIRAIEVEIDFEELGRHIFRAGVPTPATGLRGLRELLAGFALEIPGNVDCQKLWWSPSDHVADGHRSAEERSELLSLTVGQAVNSLAYAQGRILLSVSGGLDSSIVATCLARAGSDTVCLTMFTDDAEGDERMFAKALCERLGLQLIERPYRLDNIDITKAVGAHLPRPTDRTHAQAFEQMHLDVASEVGASAFMTGNGGDSVFGYSQSAAPIADRYLSQGHWRDILATLLDVCRQTGCSMVDAAFQAFRMTRSSFTYFSRPNPLFLHRNVVGALSCETLRHPWLEAPANLLPGKAAHIASILRLQHCLEHNRGRTLPLLNPLMSQPIIEACLAIPSWEWRGGGRDRAVARRAFACDLPSEVLNRKIKGSPGTFAANVLDHFLEPIRERLLRGRLAEHGIIDTIALQDALEPSRTIPGLERVRILELVNAEAWIDHWLCRRQATEQRDADIPDFTGAFRAPLQF